MAREMKIRAWDNGKNTSIKAIIFHPMETGLRKDKATGNKIPEHYITEVTCKHNGNNIMTCLWGPGVSKNPFLSFNFNGAKKGDTVDISWVDNTGKTGASSAKIS